MSDNKTAWSRTMERQPEDHLKKATFKSPGEVWVGGEEPSIEVRRRSNLKKKKKKSDRNYLKPDTMSGCKNPMEETSYNSQETMS